MIDAAEDALWVQPLISFASLILGAAISYWSTRRFDKIQQKKKDNAIAYSITFTLSGIANDLIQLNNMMVKISATRFEELKSGRDVWQLAPFTFGWDQDRSFSHEQLSLVAAMGEADLVTQLEEVATAHRLYVSVANRVSELKMEFARSDITRRVEGEIVVSEGDQEQYAKIFPLLVQLKTLADKLAYDLPEAVDDAKNLASSIGPRLKSHYKFRHLTTVDFVRRDGEIADDRDRYN